MNDPVWSINIAIQRDSCSDTPYPLLTIQLQAKCGAEAVSRFQRIAPELLGEDFSKAELELTELQAQCVALDPPAVFCHNDALAGNILIDQGTGDVHLIDFEYGGCNYRGFDIANHWNVTSLMFNIQYLILST